MRALLPRLARVATVARGRRGRGPAVSRPTEPFTVLDDLLAGVIVIAGAVVAVGATVAAASRALFGKSER
jgi:hypothetical protein